MHPEHAHRSLQKPGFPGCTPPSQPERSETLPSIRTYEYHRHQQNFGSSVDIHMLTPTYEVGTASR